MHGSLSVQKAESVVLANGSGIRGGSKLEGDVGAQSVGKADRTGLSERERSNGKGVAKYVLCIACRLQRHVCVWVGNVSHVWKSG